jgi:hypothetical protein
MCECWQELASNKSVQYGRNGVNAAVSLYPRIEGTATRYMISKDANGNKVKRLVKSATRFAVEIHFCPFCGELLDKQMQPVHYGQEK